MFSRCFETNPSNPIRHEVVADGQIRTKPLKINVRLTAWPPLAPQESQVGNAALVEREAAALPLDHAFGFELADGGPAAIEVLR